MLKTKFFDFFRNESGATAIEYGLIAAIVSTAIIASLKQISGTLQTTFNNVGTNMQTGN